MKIKLSIFTFFIHISIWIMMPFSGQAQTINPQELTTDEKVQFCEKTLSSLSGKPEEIANLIAVGEAGTKTPSLSANAAYTLNQATGIGYYYKQDFVQAKKYFEAAYLIADKAGFTELSLKPLGNLIHINHYLGNQKDADLAVSKMQYILNNNDTLKNKGDAFYNLGMYFQQQKFYYSVALNYFLKSVELHKIVADTTQSSKLKTDYATKILMVVEIYIYLKQADKALEYLEKTKPYLHQSNIVDISAYGKFIRTYALLHKKQEALHYYNLLNKILEQNPGKWSEATSSNLKMAELSLSENNFTTAKNYLDKADAQSKIDNKEILTSAVNQGYGDYYNATKDYELALEYYKKSEKGTAQFNKEQYLDLLKSITQVLLQTGNIKEASQYYQQFIQVNDSLTKQKLDINLAEMEAIFQNKDKQQQIELQQTEISNVNEQKLWLSIGIGLLILVLALLYFIYNNKKKTANILNAKSLELERLNAELSEANQSKAKLFSIISHDLRSPISQVNIFLKLQQQNEAIFSIEQKEHYSKLVQDATGQLLETMEDLLAWSKSQMNQFQVKMRTLTLNDLIEETIHFLQLQIESKNLIITNNISSNSKVWADENILKTIIRNLLQNAVKACDNNGNIYLEFIDNKLTIANNGSHFNNKNYQEAIHSDFKNNSSSGLGLKLVDELCRKTQINIQFDDAYESGTKVIIAFPQKTD